MKRFLLLPLFFHAFSGLFAQITVTNERSINSAFQEYSPAFYGKGLVFVAANPAIDKDKKEDKEIGRFTTSIFLAKRTPEGVLQRPLPFAEELTTKFYDGPMSFNAAGDVVFITRSNLKKGKPKAAKDGKVKLKIYSALLTNGTWTNITELPFCDGEADYAHPAVSADGRRLFFSSNRSGGQGGMDLYVSMNQNGTWGEPVNLGPKINTAKDEIFPFSHASGALFFSSNGRPGVGGLDIFWTKQTGNGWLAPTDLPETINSSSDDFGLILNAERTNGYFASNRASGLGDDDIYNVSIPDGLEILPTSSASVEDDLFAPKPAKTAENSQNTEGSPSAQKSNAAAEKAQKEADKMAEQKRIDDQKREETRIAAQKKAEELKQEAAKLAEQKRIDDQKRDETRLAEKKQLAEKKREEAEIAEKKREEADLAEQRRMKAEIAEAKQKEAIAAEKRRVEAHSAEQKREDARLAEEKKKEAKLAEQKREEDKIAEQKRVKIAAEMQKREEVRLAEEKKEEAKLAEQRLKEAKAAEVKREEAKSAEQKREEAKLAEAKLAEQKREDARLAEAKIEEQKREEARLVKEKIEEQKREDARLADAKREELRLSEARIAEAKREEARLEEKKRSDAKIEEIRIAQAKIAEIKAAEALIAEHKREEIRIEEKKRADAKLEEVKIAQARNAEAKIAEAKITEAKITEAKIAEAKIAEAKIAEAKIAEAKIAEAKIKEARVAETRMAEVKMTEIRMAEARKEEAKIAETSKKKKGKKRKNEAETKNEIKDETVPFTEPTPVIKGETAIVQLPVSRDNSGQNGQNSSVVAPNQQPSVVAPIALQNLNNAQNSGQNHGQSTASGNDFGETPATFEHTKTVRNGQFKQSESQNTEGSQSIETAIATFDKNSNTVISQVKVGVIAMKSLKNAVVVTDLMGKLTGLRSEDGSAIAIDELPQQTEMSNEKGRVKMPLMIGERYLFNFSKAGYEPKFILKTILVNDSRVAALLVPEKYNIAKPSISAVAKPKKEAVKPTENPIIYTENAPTMQPIETQRISYSDNSNSTQVVDNQNVSYPNNNQQVDTNITLADNFGERGMEMSRTLTQGKTFELRNIYYGFGDAELNAATKTELAPLVAMMQQETDMEIEIAAHTDSRGKAPFNLNLSQLRADNIKSFLVERDIAPERIKSIGYGETRLKNNCADNMECTEEEHQSNRRTEIRVLKGGQVLISSAKSEIDVQKDDYTEGSLLADVSTNPAKFAQNIAYPLRYLVIVGTYAKSANAEKQRQKVVSAGFVETDLVLFKDNGFYGVCVRHFDNQKEAQALSNYINSQKEFEAFVKELK
jgi:outer membrane protein OmpA-like peptidoglycan-associated protein/uncharacterized protein YjbI with pentapeptide repeats